MELCCSILKHSNRNRKDDMLHAYVPGAYSNIPHNYFLGKQQLRDFVSLLKATMLEYFEHSRRNRKYKILHHYNSIKYNYVSGKPLSLYVSWQHYWQHSQQHAGQRKRFCVNLLQLQFLKWPPGGSAVGQSHLVAISGSIV